MTVDTLQGALVGALSKMTDPSKNRTGAHGAGYLDLPALLSHVRPILAEHGLAVTQDITLDEGVLTLSTEIMHSSGETRTYGPARVNARGDMQSLGGFITYLRRYQLAAALGVAGSEDDDGHATKGMPTAHSTPEPGWDEANLPTEWEENPITEPQRKLLGILVRKAGYEDSAAFVASPLVRGVLGHDPSHPLNRTDAGKLITALKETGDDE